MLKERVALITNIPAPYRLPLFKGLYTSEGIDFRVFFCSYSEPNRDWSLKNRLEFDNEFLFNIRIAWGKKIFFNFTPFLFFNLFRLRPQVIISSGISFPTVTALLYSKIFKIPILIWWGGTNTTEKNISIFKYKFRKYLFNFVNGFLCYGQLAKNYLITMGIDSAKIYIAGNVTINVKEFNNIVNTLRSSFEKNKKEIIILMVGALIKRKNFLLPLRVFYKLIKQYKNIKLIIVGNGPEADILKNYCQSYNLSEDVKIIGYVAPEDLYRYYAEANIFVHPTLLDHWSQVVNEAMAAGLAVIVSCNDGAVEDLIRHGENGFIFNLNSETEVFKYLSMLIEDYNLTKQVGQRAFETILRYDFNFTKKIFLKAIEEVKYT